MDGETCEVLEETEQYVLLQEENEQIPFKLSKDEFDIAGGHSNMASMCSSIRTGTAFGKNCNKMEKHTQFLLSLSLRIRILVWSRLSANTALRLTTREGWFSLRRSRVCCLPGTI